MRVVTNGTLIRTEVKPGQFTEVLRRFNVLAEHGDFIWVMPLNGKHITEGPITFRRSNIQEVK